MSARANDKNGVGPPLRALLAAFALLLGLTVTGTVAMAAVTVNLSPASLSFSAQAMNSRSAIQSVTVSNTGDAVLNIAKLALGAPNGGQFAILASSTCKAGSSLAPGGTCSVDIQFAPTLNQGTGIKSSSLVLSNNGQNGGQSIGIAGTTVAAQPTTASLSATVLNYSVHPQNSSIQSVKLSNTGSQPLNIYSGAVKLVGSTPGQFALINSSTCVSASGISVAPGGNCTLVVQYKPAASAVVGTSHRADINFTLNTDAPLAVVLTGEVSDAAQVYYIHADHLDTPRQITDTAGNVVWEWQNLDPFGNNVPNENPSGLGTFEFDLGFAGMVRDKETGLFQNHHREYDPALGRYPTSDPMGLAGGSWSTYPYALNNPLRYTDPSGLCPWCPIIIPLLEIGMMANDAATGDDVPIPGGGAAKAGKKAGEAASCAADGASKVFSKEKQALIDMAKADKKAGVTRADMEAYEELNKGMKDPFPANKVRTDEGHLRGEPHSQVPHGHVGPVDHIPIVDP